MPLEQWKFCLPGLLQGACLLSQNINIGKHITEHLLVACPKGKQIQVLFKPILGSFACEGPAEVYFLTIRNIQTLVTYKPDDQTDLKKYSATV